MRKNWIGRLLMVVLTTLLCCGVAYAAEPTELTVTLVGMNENPTSHEMVNNAFKLTYDGASYCLQVTDSQGNTLGEDVEIGILYFRPDSTSGSSTAYPKDANNSVYTANIVLEQQAMGDGSFQYTLPGYTGQVAAKISQSYSIKIAPQPVLVTYDRNQFIYDGTDKSPSVVTFYKEDDTKAEYSLPHHLSYYPEDGAEALSGAPTDAGSYEVSCTLGTTNYCWGESAGNYAFTISKCELSMSDFKVGNTYTGAEITPTYTLTGSNSKTYDQTDGLLTPAYTYGKTENDAYASVAVPQNAGHYVASYTLSDADNFALSGDAEKILQKFEISPLVLRVTPSEETSFVYDGSAKAPAYTLTDSNDAVYDNGLATVTYFSKTNDADYDQLTGAPVDAGTYKVEYSPMDAVNYTLSPDTSIEFDIAPCPVTITPEADVSPVYDGEDWLHRVFEEGTDANGDSILIDPDLDTVGDIDVWLKYTANSKADAALVSAGEYAVQFALAGDGAGNYVLSDGENDVDALEFTVNVAKRTIQVVELSGLVYTGEDLMMGCFDAYYDDPSYNWQADSDVGKLELRWELMKDGAPVPNGEMIGAGTYAVTLTIAAVDDGTVMDNRDLIENYQFGTDGAENYETTVTVAKAALELEIFEESARTFVYGEQITNGADYKTPDNWAVPEDAQVVQWSYQDENGVSSDVLPTDVGAYTVTCSVADDYKNDVTMELADSASYQIIIEPKPITLTLEEQTVNCLPGSNETFSYVVPDTAGLGVLSSDLERGGVKLVARYRELGTTGDYSEDQPRTIGVYEVEVRLEGERADQYQAELAYSTFTVQFATEGIGAEGATLYLRHGKAYHLGGSGMCWQIKSEQSQVTYRGGMTFYLSPDADEGDYTFLYIGGGT